MIGNSIEVEGGPDCVPVLVDVQFGVLQLERVGADDDGAMAAGGNRWWWSFSSRCMGLEDGRWGEGQQGNNGDESVPVM